MSLQGKIGITRKTFYIYQEGMEVVTLAVEIGRTAHGAARPATPEEIERENRVRDLAVDTGLLLCTDNGVPFRLNVPEFGYTNPDLHRRIVTDPEFEPGVHYPFEQYDESGNPYNQSVVLGVWDGLHSFRTTSTYTHDEESTTCEIP